MWSRRSRKKVPTPDDVELDDLIDKVMDIIDEKIKISQAKAAY
ncbi:MAG: hypothetical protein ACLU80_11695 [Dorea sp.]